MAEIKVKSEMNGLVFQLLCEVGCQVEADEPIMILESMKMEQPVVAPRRGRLISVLVKEGQTVAEGDVLAILET